MSWPAFRAHAPDNSIHRVPINSTQDCVSSQNKSSEACQLDQRAVSLEPTQRNYAKHLDTCTIQDKTTCISLLNVPIQLLRSPIGATLALKPYKSAQEHLMMAGNTDLFQSTETSELPGLSPSTSHTKYPHVDPQVDFH